MFKFAYTFAFTCVLSIHAHAQNFDYRQGYIFEQSFVTRISEEQARQRLQIPEVNAVLLQLHAQHGKSEMLPHGVQRQGAVLSFSSPGRPALRLKSYHYKGKDDGGDSQKFVYLKREGNYHIVCAEFDHDAPGFLLIDKDNLQVFFVNH